MKKEYPRALRVGEQIHRELALLIRDSVKDPRVNGVILSEVQVSRDLARARVFYTVFGQTGPKDEVQKGLQSAAPFLRKRLGEILHIRVIPELRFEYDTIADQSARLEEILRENLPVTDWNKE